MSSKAGKMPGVIGIHRVEVDWLVAHGKERHIKRLCSLCSVERNVHRASKVQQYDCLTVVCTLIDSKEIRNIKNIKMHICPWQVVQQTTQPPLHVGRLS
jgi:hypothetical protein